MRRMPAAELCVVLEGGSVEGRLGYRLHREKFGDHYLFVEWDWDDCGANGTAIPLRRLAADPPSDDAGLLDWLAQQEGENRDEIRAYWPTTHGCHVERQR